MEQLLKQLTDKPHMNTHDLYDLLTDQISSVELKNLESVTEDFIISEYNRLTILRMMKAESIPNITIDCIKAASCIRTLQDYLGTYMQDQPSGHKWIIICCLFLSFIRKEPMHPQGIVKWQRDEKGEFSCPAYSDVHGSTCRSQ